MVGAIILDWVGGIVGIRSHAHGKSVLTFVPGSRLSAVIFAFSSGDHRSRRSRPVITSIRRGRSLRSSPRATC
jgi:hypothetical protein